MGGLCGRWIPAPGGTDGAGAVPLSGAPDQLPGPGGDLDSDARGWGSARKSGPYTVDRRVPDGAEAGTVPVRRGPAVLTAIARQGLPVAIRSPQGNVPPDSAQDRHLTWRVPGQCTGVVTPFTVDSDGIQQAPGAFLQPFPGRYRHQHPDPVADAPVLVAYGSFLSTGILLFRVTGSGSTAGRCLQTCGWVPV